MFKNGQAPLAKIATTKLDLENHLKIFFNTKKAVIFLQQDLICFSVNLYGEMLDANFSPAVRFCLLAMN